MAVSSIPFDPEGGPVGFRCRVTSLLECRFSVTLLPDPVNRPNDRLLLVKGEKTENGKCDLHELPLEPRQLDGSALMWSMQAEGRNRDQRYRLHITFEQGGRRLKSFTYKGTIREHVSGHEGEARLAAVE